MTVPPSSRAAVVAVLGPTATGKSRLGVELALRLGGEIINCDSTAVFRGFDIGTDKVDAQERRGVAHHLVDIADPTEPYSAAHYARDAAAIVADVLARGRLPILVGGTGFYYRALTRGLFPGPGRDEALRARLLRAIERFGAERVHHRLRGIDPASASRIQPRDTLRVVRALEVYILTGVPLSAHFAATRSLIAHVPVHAIALTLPAERIAARVAARVERQFERGIVAEVERLLAAGVPRSARPFSGLVYRQVLEMLDGVRDESATRALIVRENRQYARRQLIWFRKEPNLRWLSTPGEHPDTLDAAVQWLALQGLRSQTAVPTCPSTPDLAE